MSAICEVMNRLEVYKFSTKRPITYLVNFIRYDSLWHCSIDPSLKFFLEVGPYYFFDWNLEDFVKFKNNLLMAYFGVKF